MKVTLFVTCLVDMFASDVGKDMVEVLERLGCEVEFPAKQTCCGQPAYNSGYLKEAKEPMKHMINTFSEAEYIVTPSGSCAAMFKEYPHVFSNDPEWEEKAEKIASKTYEFSQFIVQVCNVTNVGARLPHKATFHTSCHMTRILGEKSTPFQLLNEVEGLELIPLPHHFDCCGFGGTFSVKMPKISKEMVDEKMNHILETDAEILIGADSGCLMNIGGRITRSGKRIKIMHLANVLNSK